MLEFRRPYTFRRIIDDIRRKMLNDSEYYLHHPNGWCIYSADEKLTLDSVCYIEDYASVTEDDEEVFPDFVLENGLEFAYTRQLLEDVIGSALYQNEFADNNLIFRALEYYDEYDDFMDIRSAPIKKKKFSVLVTSIGFSKIKVVKAVSQIMNISINEANEKLKNLPLTVKHTVSKEEAEEIRRWLVLQGAKVKLK